MDAEYSRGQRLFVETTFGNLEGIFHYMDRSHNRLTLIKSVNHKSGEKMEGFLHCYRNEVISGKFCMSTYTRVKFITFFWQIC